MMFRHFERPSYYLTFTLRSIANVVANQRQICIITGKCWEIIISGDNSNPRRFLISSNPATNFACLCFISFSFCFCNPITQTDVGGNCIIRRSRAVQIITNNSTTSKVFHIFFFFPTKDFDSFLMTPAHAWLVFN